MSNSKRSSRGLSKQAAKTLSDPNASALQRSLAGSVLRQSSTNAQTGASMEEKASRAAYSGQTGQRFWLKLDTVSG